MHLSHRSLLVAVWVIAAVALLGVVLLWPRAAEEPLAEEAPQTTELVSATLLEVTELTDVEAVGLLPGAVELLISARIERTGEVVSFEMSDETGAGFRAGQRVKLAVIEAEGVPTSYIISDFERTGPLLLLVVLFVAAVVAFGRFQGLRALLGLVGTFVVIIGFMIPAILADRPPVLVALVGAVIVMILTLYLSHGTGPKTTAAVVGTALALLLTGALAAAFVAAANITGFTSEEARLANYSVGGLSLRGLLLAGIIIGGLGVLDDVTMSQASTVFALHRADPAAGFGQLVRGALDVGRDHIAATVNTLFLAYAGASLPLLILFVTGSDPFTTVATSEVVAVEVVRTLVGSIGLIAAVPLTTALAAALAGSEADTGGTERVGMQTVRAMREDSPANDEWESELRASYGLPPKGERHTGPPPP